jgi:hypothetical protein
MGSEKGAGMIRNEPAYRKAQKGEMVCRDCFFSEERWWSNRLECHKEKVYPAIVRREYTCDWVEKRKHKYEAPKLWEAAVPDTERNEKESGLVRSFIKHLEQEGMKEAEIEFKGKKYFYKNGELTVEGEKEKEKTPENEVTQP